MLGIRYYITISENLMVKLSRNQINKIKNFFSNTCGAQLVRMANGGLLWKLTYISDNSYYREGRPHWEQLGDGYDDLEETIEGDVLNKILWKEIPSVFENEDGGFITSIYFIKVNEETLKSILNYENERR